jgi:MoxR-like ATPase
MPDPYFLGFGGPRHQVGQNLPTPDRDALADPEHYQTPPDLAAAVDVALTLGMPLLLTGEPGSGKSGLAARVRWELGLGPRLLTYVVKSNTEATDLFYHFDTLGRFHAASTPSNDSDQADPRRFIRFRALGLALLHALGPATANELLGPYATALKIQERTRCVVLIDEIDKAPRDVPNDILDEIERMRCEIPELAGPRAADGADVGIPVLELGKDDALYRPIVIFTSNSERALPEPFVRRCAYHHLELPPYEPEGQQVSVLGIVQARIGARFRIADGPLLKDAVNLLRALRDDPAIERKPSLAELLDWLEAVVARYGKGALADSGPLTLKRIADDNPSWLTHMVNSLLLKRPEDRLRGRDQLARMLDAARAETATPNAPG